ncbi:hypothetical protein HI914_03902 [Erysiphe necator]|nr:hypothetical protein HI914_03902 [Erysiphe necator]
MMASTTAKAYPQGGTIIDTFKRSFTDVPVDEEKDNSISSTEFLEAAESMTALFDILGSLAFQPVKKDILGNIKVKNFISFFFYTFNGFILSLTITWFQAE